MKFSQIYFDSSKSKYYLIKMKGRIEKLEIPKCF